MLDDLVHFTSRNLHKCSSKLDNAQRYWITYLKITLLVMVLLGDKVGANLVASKGFQVITTESYTQPELVEFGKGRTMVMTLIIVYAMCSRVTLLNCSIIFQRKL